MKAVLSKSVGGPETLVLEEVADPVAKAGQVLLAVKALGADPVPRSRFEADRNGYLAILEEERVG